MDTLDEAISVPEDPEEVFDELIVHNSLVCQNCYRRLRRRFEISWAYGRDHEDIAGWIDRHLPEDYKWEIAESEYRETETIRTRTVQTHHPDGSPSSSSQACWNCGILETHRSPPTLSKEDAVERAANISVTLREYNVAHDWMLLLGRVKDLKSDPSMAGNDYKVFCRAVTASIEVV
jgi:hypothetical protein